MTDKDITKLAANVEIDLLLRRLSGLDQEDHAFDCGLEIGEDRCNCGWDFNWQELARDACAKLEEFRR